MSARVKIPNMRKVESSSILYTFIYCKNLRRIYGFGNAKK